MRNSEFIYRCIACVTFCAGAIAMALFGPPILAVLLVVVAAIQAIQVVYGS